MSSRKKEERLAQSEQRTGPLRHRDPLLAEGAERAQLPIRALDGSSHSGHYVLVTARAPTADERSFLDALLAHEFDGVEPLRIQRAHSLVEPSCHCGCGSIGFIFEADFVPSPSTAVNPLPVEGEVIDSHGGVVGGIIVLVRDGLLDDVDVHAYGDEALPFPSPASIRWHKRA